MIIWLIFDLVNSICTTIICISCPAPQLLNKFGLVILDENLLHTGIKLNHNQIHKKTLETGNYSSGGHGELRYSNWDTWE